MWFDNFISYHRIMKNRRAGLKTHDYVQVLAVPEASHSDRVSEARKSRISQVQYLPTGIHISPWQIKRYGNHLFLLPTYCSRQALARKYKRLCVNFPLLSSCRIPFLLLFSPAWNGFSACNGCFGKGSLYWSPPEWVLLVHIYLHSWTSLGLH